jgi:membrane-bound serine protease (ClpP class)
MHGLRTLYAPFREGWLALITLVWLGLGSQVLAGPGGVDGLFITVRTITSKEKDRIQLAANQAISRFRAVAKQRHQDGVDERQFKIVLDFNPDEQQNASDDFGACYSLAKFLLDKVDPDIVTIAFVHGQVSGYSVLPALACTDLVMSAQARLGEAQVDAKLEKDAYIDVFQRRHPNALVPCLRLLDKQLRVRRVVRLKDNSPIFVDARWVPEGAKGRTDVLIDGEKVAVRVDKGESDSEDPVLDGTSSFDGARARKYGLCERILEKREDVATAFALPAASLRGDPLLGHTPKAWRIDVEGEITAAQTQSLLRQIRHAIGQGSNLILLRLRNCGGGNVRDALAYAHKLSDAKDPDFEDNAGNRVTIVAYIPGDAPDTATIIALGCSMIIMRQGATLGDFRKAHYEQADIDSLKSLAKKQGYAEALIDGMTSEKSRVVKIENAKHEWRVVTEAEKVRDFPEADWKIVEEVKGKSGLLILSADKARDLNVALDVVNADENDLGPLYKLFGVEPGDVQSSKRDWLDGVADVLRSPYMSVLLVLIGIICLILEMKLPGATVPIIIAAVCFILFFWAHSLLSGQFTWLAVLLFVLGLILIAVEVFVLPGFGVTGISGIALVLLSLALVTLEHKPESPRDWLEFGKTLTMFGVTIVGAVGIAIVLATHLHHIPYLNRLVLRPAGQGEVDGEGGDDATPALHRPDLAELLGAIGVSATPLRPAGKVQFGEEFVDVVAESGYVAPGTRVQVVEVEGNRIVVKEV